MMKVIMRSDDNTARMILTVIITNTIISNNSYCIVNIMRNVLIVLIIINAITVKRAIIL